MTAPPLHTGLRTATFAIDWSAWDTCGRLVVTDPDVHALALEVLSRELAVVGRAFRTRFAARRAFRDGGWSPSMPDGPALAPFPYGLASASPDEPVHVELPSARCRAAGPRRRRLRIGLGPSLRAWTAQRCAEAVAEETLCGVLVAIGGDVATSGLAPATGWRVRLPGGADAAPAVLALDGGAVSWADLSMPGRTEPRELVVAPNGRTVRTHWRSVAVVAATAPAASAACTGALVSGRAAVRRLNRQGLPARLTDGDGRVRDVGWWPGSER